MKTGELIRALAADAGRARPARPGRRFALAAAAGAAAALLLMIGGLGWAPLPDIGSRPWFWMKLGYAAGLAAPAFLLAVRLSRSGVRYRPAIPALAAVVLLMLVAGAVQLALLPPEARQTAWRGATWTVCSLRILTLGAPIGLLLFGVARTLAPTETARAGAAIGLLSGSLAAALYALHCPEWGVAFVAIWYSLGIAAATAAGAVAGRFLRW